MQNLRIASFLPAGTEMICALGLLDQLTCISHECDFPSEVKKKPIGVRCAIDLTNMSVSEIDKAVSEHLKKGKSLYQIDENVLKELKPNLIVTQNLCQVCAPSGNEASQALAALSPKPDVIFQTPTSFEGVLEDIKLLGSKTGKEKEAQRIIDDALKRVDAVSKKTAHLSTKPSVFFMEWVDPVYCSGHWMAKMIRWAGGEDRLAQDGKDSVRIPWEKVTEYQPEILIVSPCGFDAEKSEKQIDILRNFPNWCEIPAVRNKRVYAVDANAYFSRPGPRLVDGVELLAHLLHPELFKWNGSPEAFRKIH